MKQSNNDSFDLDHPELVSAYDQIPLWSAPFGMMLLDRVKIQPHMTVLDIGCGTGFPLLELAQRLGTTCRLYGIDPWKGAVDRIRLKMQHYQIENVEILLETAENMKFDEGTFDLVVSNLGINNVADPDLVLQRCAKACKRGAQLLLTVNLPGTMREFYDVFESVLRSLGKDQEVQKMYLHIHDKRKPLHEVTATLERSGFEVVDTVEDSFRIRFRTELHSSVISSSGWHSWGAGEPYLTLATRIQYSKFWSAG